MTWSARIPEAPSDWVFIPLDGQKRPIDPHTGNLKRNWQSQQGYTIEEMEGLSRVKAVGLILGSRTGTLAVDFDGPDATSTFKEIFGRSDQELPPTIAMTSGKKHRCQRLFAVHQEFWPRLKGRKAWTDRNGNTCLELRWDGHQSVLAGAHPETDGYSWLPSSSPADRELADAPDWLLEPLLTQEDHLPEFVPTSNDAQRAVEMLKFIDPLKHTSYDDWLKVGLALHHTNAGLLTAWIDWARPMPNFDEGEHLTKWQSFQHRADGITIRSLHYWAKQGGYQEQKKQYAPLSLGTDPTEQDKGGADAKLLGYTELLDLILESITQERRNKEMEGRAELKHRFRVSDDQINTALFNQYTDGKVARAKRRHNSVRMAEIKRLSYRMDGWIQRGDVGLTYGSFGTGKTTLMVWKAYCLAKGTNMLDRNTPCEPGKSLLIATDSGVEALLKTCEGLGIDPENDPLFAAGHPDQMIHIWGYAPEQGHAAWICNIHGVIQLERLIRDEQIEYVGIDSAKSVSSSAGWSYTSNESVQSVIKYLREAVAKPTGCFIEFLSHDGTNKGAHAGAKAWAEDPSMVIQLELIKDEATGKESVVCQFKKDRAAAVDPRRKVTYCLQDQQIVLAPEVEVVGCCDEALLTIAWNAYCNGVEVITKKELSNEAFARFKYSSKTVENTLAKVTGNGKGNDGKPLIRKGRGLYSMAPHEIQRREALRNRTLSLKGGGSSKPTARQGVCLPPKQPPEGGTRGDAKPPSNTVGGTVGGEQMHLCNKDVSHFPPGGGVAPPRTHKPFTACDDDPYWPPRAG